MPIDHGGLVWAGAYGYANGSDVPGPGTLAGAAFIVAGCLAPVWSERRRAA